MGSPNLGDPETSAVFTKIFELDQPFLLCGTQLDGINGFGPVELCDIFRSIGERQVATNSAARMHTLGFASANGSHGSGQLSASFPGAPFAGHSFGRLDIDAINSEELNRRTPVPCAVDRTRNPSTVDTV